MRYLAKNKRGTATVFLALILSSVILVQCTYYTIVADLDRKMTLSRAAAAQVETFLADYDRTLFSVYGIYAFDLCGVDSSVFDSVLAVNGIDDGEILAVSGVDTFDTDDLRRAIAVYYSYRMTAVSVNSFVDCLSGALEGLDTSEVTRALRRFARSDAATLLGQIIERTGEVTEALSSLGVEFDISDLARKVGLFGNLMDSLDDLDAGYLDPDHGIDMDSFSFAIEAVNAATSFFDTGASVIEDVAFHPFAVHYASYNFDCTVGDHSSINGTAFTDLHDGVCSDSEYILTGLNGNAGQYGVNMRIYGFMIVRNIIAVLTDPQKREVVDAVAEILRAVILVLTVGTCDLPDWVYRMLVAYLYAKIVAVGDYTKIVRGETVAILTYGQTEVLRVGYREILCFYMNFVSDSVLLERMACVIERDFPDYACGITVETYYKGEVISFERSYAMYE